jgi:hypothetical protein
LISACIYLFPNILVPFVPVEFSLIPFETSTFYLGQPPGALLGAELFHICGDGGLVGGVGEEFTEEFLASVVTECYWHCPTGVPNHPI